MVVGGRGNGQGVALVGIAARYWHLKQEKPEPYQPEGVAMTEEVRSE